MSFLDRTVARVRARYEDQRTSLKQALASGGIIAEIKRASPSAGKLADLDVAARARSYERAGANALSVLTDESFEGTIDDLRAVARATHLPVLRKDFIVHEMQLHEALVAGASAVLLIVRALGDRELRYLYARAKALGLESIVECHDEAELDRALTISPEIISINSRNLDTLEVDLAVTERLLPKIPRSAIAVSCSGIRTRQDIDRLRRAGASAFLIGEALSRTVEPEALLKELLA